MSDGINLAQRESQLAAALAGNELGGLRSGATGQQPAHRDAAGELAEQMALEDATPLARDAAMAYREVMGDRQQRERDADSARSQPSRSTFL